jgi:hypothetical protein
MRILTIQWEAKNIKLSKPWQGSCSSPRESQQPLTNRKNNMNKLKYIAAMLIAVAGLGLQQAQAHLVQTDEFSVAALGSGQAERDFLVGKGDLEDCCQFGARFDGTTNDWETPPSAGIVNVTLSADGKTADISWDLTGTGLTLCGVLIKDGVGTNQGESIYRFYDVTAGEETQGDGTVTFADFGRNGRQISHISFFFCSEGGVPDGGTTVMLLGAALGALGMARRFLIS